MSNEKPEMKPCPFCGCEMCVYKQEYGNGKFSIVISGKHKTGCYLEHDTDYIYFDTVEEAAETWNRRANDAE